VAAPGRTRERILDVALDHFAEHGFAGTSISDIEREVGLAAGTGSFHRHFRSKEELLHAAVEREVERLLVDVEVPQVDPVRDTEDAHDRRVRVLARFLADIRRFDRLFRLMLNEGDRLPELRATMEKALGLSESGSAWDQEVDTVVAVAALAGYHYLGLMQGRPFQGIPASDFVAALARFVPGPPDVARQRRRGGPPSGRRARG
jgi:AcrR family transcriptional regulator